VARRALGAADNLRASRSWWDAEAEAYQAEHGDFLGDADFVWCPEGLREADARLLGEVAGRRVVEVGCGAAAAARWLAAQGAQVVALDLSAGMLRQAMLGRHRSGGPGTAGAGRRRAPALPGRLGGHRVHRVRCGAVRR